MDIDGKKAPTATRATTTSTTAWAYAKHVLCLLIAVSLVGHFTIESPLWGLGRYVTNEKAKWFPPKLLEMTPVQLAQYDGRDISKPIYIGIDGDVYDVSASRRMYGPGSSYNCFAGKDAARAFITGCFDTHLTHDLRGLSREELARLDAWKSFFRGHQKYRKVGTVLNPHINSEQPLPVPCKSLQAQQQEPAAPPIVSRI